MPLNSTRGAGSAKGFGLTAGGFKEYALDILVVAGGGAARGCGCRGAGGGAGGYRLFTSQLTKGVQSITIGAGGPDSGPSPSSKGADSSFGSLVANGGGYGAGLASAGGPGGSGGGGGSGGSVFGPLPCAGAGNSPPTSPSQGNPGGQGNLTTYPGGGSPNLGGGGGGGAGGAGTSGCAVPGGPGASATPVFGAAPQPFYLSNTPTTGATSPGTFAGGGGGANCVGGAGSGGTGGGGNAGAGPTGGKTGRANSGGGGGAPISAGGSGIVLIKAPSSASITVTPGTNTVTTVCGPSPYKVAQFTVTGTFLAN